MSFMRPDGGGRARAPRRTATNSNGGLSGPAAPLTSRTGSLPGSVGTIGGRQVNASGQPLSGPPSPLRATAVTAPAGGGFGGGGGMGGGGGGGAMPEAPALTLEDFIKNHILKRQADAESERMLEDFDSETMRLTQETEADQAVRKRDLDMMLADQAQDATGSLAARGLERSGLLFQAQDRINEEGVRRRGQIDDLMTSLVGERGRGRQDVQRNAQQLINERIQQLSQMFNQGNVGQIGI